jgi:hypothetical protein
MSKKPITLETEDYRIILTALAFMIGIDLSLETPEEKINKEVLATLEKVKKLGFKRKPKLTALSYSKSAIKENKEVLDGILQIVDLVEEE